MGVYLWRNVFVTVMELVKILSTDKHCLCFKYTISIIEPYRDKTKFGHRLVRYTTMMRTRTSTHR